MQVVMYVVSGCMLAGCVFNFDVTSQRTALENQVMGEYEELDDELILMSTVRGPSSPDVLEGDEEAAYIRAINNQRFNRDDLDELLTVGAVGEGVNGHIKLIRKGGKLTKSQEANLKSILIEENSDRTMIWDYLAKKKTLSLSSVREIYSSQRKDRATKNQWIEKKSGEWIQKKE